MGKNPARRNSEVVLPQRVDAMRALISEVIPVCTICGLTIQGHLFKHVACTPITKGKPERSMAMIESVRAADWEALRDFQEWEGISTSVDVIGLKCADGQCSLAVLLCPAQLEEPYALMLQQLVPGCDGPVAGAFWGNV